MARGRMLNQSVAKDDRLNALSQEAMLLYLMTIPHLDRDGLIDGRPRVLWADAAPLRTDLYDAAPRIIQEWIDAGLAIRYPGLRTPVLFFPSFQRNQAGMRYDHETPSTFPPPPGYYRERNGMQPVDGQLTDNVRTLSGACPPELEVEDQVEDQLQEQPGEVALPLAPPSPSVEAALDGAPITSTDNRNTPKSMTQQPVVVAYRAVFQRYPAKAQMAQLLAHGVTDLPRWDRVLTAWLMAGYKPTNVGGMLDWYDQPERMTANTRTGPGPHAEPTTEAERIRKYVPDEYAHVINRKFEVDP